MKNENKTEKITDMNVIFQSVQHRTHFDVAQFISMRRKGKLANPLVLQRLFRHSLGPSNYLRLPDQINEVRPAFWHNGLLELLIVGHDPSVDMVPS